jgi:hypothetical protein
MVTIAIVTPLGTDRSRSLAFIGGEQGRLRAAVAAAARLAAILRAVDRLETERDGT